MLGRLQLSSQFRNIRSERTVTRALITVEGPKSGASSVAPGLKKQCFAFSRETKARTATPMPLRRGLRVEAKSSTGSPSQDHTVTTELPPIRPEPGESSDAQHPWQFHDPVRLLGTDYRGGPALVGSHVVIETVDRPMSRGQYEHAVSMMDPLQQLQRVGIPPRLEGEAQRELNLARCSHPDRGRI
jgi:hypothetical protein